MSETQEEREREWDWADSIAAQVLNGLTGKPELVDRIASALRSERGRWKDCEEALERIAGPDIDPLDPAYDAIEIARAALSRMRGGSE